MANLALKKLPLELDWKEPELGTNGDILNYDGKNGFTRKAWPCTYTIDLEKEYPINTIRFLLWDGLGKSNINKVRDKRKYKYALLTSKDNIEWDSWYEVADNGVNGWQSFEFNNNYYARYVRLDCKYNNVNEEFHIVEFEVHDETPPILNAEITRSIIVSVAKLNEEIIFHKLKVRFSNVVNEYNEKFNSFITGLQSDAQNIKKLNEEIGKTKSEIDTNLKTLNLVNKSLHFLEEAMKNKRASNWWLLASICSVGIFLFVILNWFNTDSQFIDIVYEANEKFKAIQELKSTTLIFEFARVMLFKFLLTFISLYSLLFCVKNFKAQKHNYTINAHKAMSLVAVVELLDKVSSENKDKILIQATQVIFSHQITGYSDNSNEPNPNIISSVIENIQPK